MVDRPEQTIFVSVPSYRDSECPRTVEDAFAKAEHPGRVFVGVFEQNDPVEDHAFYTGTVLAGKPFMSNVRIKTVPYDEARGPIFARSVIEQELFQDEDYVLCIDSHTLFSPHWDSEAIRQLHMADSSKPILSCYPEDFDRRSRALPRHQPPTFLKLRTFHPKLGFTELDRGRCVAFPERPLRSLFWAAGFSFAPGQLIREVPFDPNLQYVFLGEELSMSLRFFTHGWDTFSPMTNIVFHYTPRDYRTTFWELFYKRDGVCKVPHAVRAQRKTLEIEGNNRVMDLATGVPVDPPYGLGTERTLEHYSDFTGVNIAERKAKRHAYLGLTKTPDEHEKHSKYGDSLRSHTLGRPA